MSGDHVDGNKMSFNPVIFRGIYILGNPEAVHCPFIQLTNVFCTNTRGFELEAAVWERQLLAESASLQTTVLFCIFFFNGSFFLFIY